VCDAHCDHGDHGDHGDDELHGHQHDPSVDSVSMRFDKAFDKARLDAWLAELTRGSGENLFRFKGILAIAGDDRRYVLQGVHRLVDLHSADPWGARQPSSKLVFIGRGLDAAVLKAGLARCLAG
jgi:G3E family GTPase